MQKGYFELYEDDDSYNLINKDTINNNKDTINNNKDKQISLNGFNPLIRLIFYFTKTSINLKE